jgi:hypothetical protein
MGTVTLKPVQPVPVSEEVIMIGTARLGTVKTITDQSSFKFHVILESKNMWSIYQGFGQTVDEAMRDAIEKNRDRRFQEINELETLENIIWGDHEIN